jgi:branched-chain amino acid transport system ATP-binding protein
MRAEFVSGNSQVSTGAAGETQLAISGVSKHFGGVRAVEGVSLSVRRGGLVSVIGPNGAGKTSLLNMISGFYRPDTGSITFEGKDITGARPSQVAMLGIARTFQNIALFSGMTVLFKHHAGQTCG